MRQYDAIQMYGDLCTLGLTEPKQFSKRVSFVEDMSEEINLLEPYRWKVFMCLLIEGENVGPDAKRNAENLAITPAEFENFCARHKEIKSLVKEDNEKMRNSYLILDEYLCFLNCTSGGKLPSESIREVSVWQALRQAGFDAEMFVARQGRYEWNKMNVLRGNQEMPTRWFFFGLAFCAAAMLALLRRRP